MTTTGVRQLHPTTTARTREKRFRSRPALRLLVAEPRGAPPTPSNVLEDLEALIDAGLVEAVVDNRGVTRYGVVDPFAGTSDLDNTAGGAA